MDPYRRDYASEEHHHHHFQHRPPPPPQDEEFDCCSDDERIPPFPPHHQTPPHYVPADPYLPHHTSPPDPYLPHPTLDPYISSQKEDVQPSAALSPQGQLVRLFCKANPSFNLAVQHNGVIMVPANSEDEAQQWVKDASYGMRVKDNYGHPAFSLVNKATNKILKHAKEKGQQVLLMDYRPGIRDDDILWTESQDFGEGFKTVRSASDTLLNMTVFEGNKKIRNGSALVLDTWHTADHQLWKVFPL